MIREIEIEIAQFQKYSNFKNILVIAFEFVQFKTVVYVGKNKRIQCFNKMDFSLFIYLQNAFTKSLTKCLYESSKATAATLNSLNI